MATIKELDLTYSRAYTILDSATKSAIEVIEIALEKQVAKPSSPAWLILSGLKTKLTEASFRAKLSQELKATI